MLEIKKVQVHEYIRKYLFYNRSQPELLFDILRIKINNSLNQYQLDKSFYKNYHDVMINFKEKLEKVFVTKRRHANGQNLDKNQRKHAVDILKLVIYQKSSLNHALESYQQLSNDQNNMSLIKELCFGTIRWFYQLEAIANELLEKPLPDKHQDIMCLLIVGLYQILYTRIPDHAAVNETVATAKKIKKPWAASLVNKILRRFIKEKEEVLLKINRFPHDKYAHPKWLLEAIQKDWPLQWEEIVTNNNQHPPMFIRVNSSQITTHDYQQKLTEAGIKTTHYENCSTALKLEKPVPVAKLPGFNEGECSLQDLSGQFVAELLDLKPNFNILDTCAAPGSKTCHILEKEPHINKLVAVDINANRLIKITENLQRLKLPNGKIKLVLDDATHTRQWWDGNLFDRILLDVPCSATGVIRRHPEIKILRTPKDIAQLKQIQQRLLRAAWPLLKPGGKLLYTTCSILNEENQMAIEQFMATIKNAKILPIDLKNTEKSNSSLQFLPKKDGYDGFFFCLLEKFSK